MEKETLVVIDYDIHQKTIWKPQKDVSGIVIFLNFGLFEPIRKKLPKYDEKLLSIDNILCLFDVLNNEKTYYQISDIKKRDRDHGYYVYLIEKHEGE